MKMSKFGIIFLVIAGIFLFPFAKVSGVPKEEVVVLTDSNTVVLTGVIEGESVAKVIVKVKELNQLHFVGSKPIYLFLNTPGGEIQTGLEMLEALHGSKRPVNTVTLFAASMGFQTVQNLGERLILKNGVMMSHRAAGRFEGYFGGPFPSQVEGRYRFWLSRLDGMDKQTVSRTNGKQTLESYQKAYADELWLTGGQSVNGGYSDRVVTARCDSSLDGVTTHSLDFLGVQISYDLDNCPLNTSPMNIHAMAPSNEKSKFTLSQLQEIKDKFLKQYVESQHAVVPYYQ
jgi:ATP-dependent Clp protease protease subunit